MGYCSLLILYKQVWHCKWIHYYCTLGRSVSLLWELKIRDLLLHAVYALLPVSFPHVFNAKTKCIRQHFCQVFFFILHFCTCGCRRGVAGSFLSVLFIYKQHHLSAAISIWSSLFAPSLPPAPSLDPFCCC